MPKKPESVLVSACLVGQTCRYDAKPIEISSSTQAFLAVLEEKGISTIACCPEAAGGLSTPRAPAEIEATKTALDVLNGKGRVLTQNNLDATDAFIKGAQSALKICQENNVRLAFFKNKSPSCGSCTVYDGTFSHTLCEGHGVTAELLKQHGIRIMNEDDVERLVNLAQKLHG